MNEKLMKETEFVGIASGDWECFCFDRLIQAERADVDRKAEEFVEYWPEGFDPDAERIYTRALLPEGADGKRGRWRIVVEFTPEEA